MLQLKLVLEHNASRCEILVLRKGRSEELSAMLQQQRCRVPRLTQMDLQWRIGVTNQWICLRVI